MSPRLVGISVFTLVCLLYFVPALGPAAAIPLLVATAAGLVAYRIQRAQNNGKN